MSNAEQSLPKNEQRRQTIKSFEARALRSRSLLTQVADDLTAIFGSTTFLFLNIAWFSFWIPINLGWFEPTIPAFDPYPFGLLTMIVSLEAIFLSIFVLVSQNRSAYMNSLREEIHLQVNLIAEEEITKILDILSDMRKKMGIKEEDPKLEKMLQRIDTNYIEQSIENQILRASKPISQQVVTAASEMPKAIVQTPMNIVQNLSNGGESGEHENKKNGTKEKKA